MCVGWVLLDRVEYSFVGHCCVANPDSVSVSGRSLLLFELWGTFIEAGMFSRTESRVQCYTICIYTLYY
jgi:hypothetical protein